MPTTSTRSLTSFDAATAAVVVAAIYHHQMDRAREKVEELKSLLCGISGRSYYDDSIWLGNAAYPGALYYDGRRVDIAVFRARLRWYEQWLAYGGSLNARR